MAHVIFFLLSPQRIKVSFSMLSFSSVASSCEELIASKVIKIIQFTKYI